MITIARVIGGLAEDLGDMPGNPTFAKQFTEVK
jgi:hypothetical protein